MDEQKEKLSLKKLLLIALFAVVIGTAIAPFTQANTVSDVRISPNIPLGSQLTVYAKYSDVNKVGNVVCSFYVFDTNNNQPLITRLSDEYTAADGTITSTPITLNEPLFRRGADYNVVILCNTAINPGGGVFHVGQKEDVAFGIRTESMIWDFAFWTDPENSVTAAFFGILIIVVLVFAFFLLRKAGIKI